MLLGFFFPFTYIMSGEMYWVLVKDHFWQGFLWYMRFQTHLQATVAGQDEITLNLHTSVHRNYENARLIQLSKMQYFVICWLSPDVLLVEMSRIHWILKACLWLHSSTQIIQACTPEMLAIIYACFVLSWQCKFQAEFGESRVVGDSTYTVLTGSLWPTCSWQWPLSSGVYTGPSGTIERVYHTGAL